jgi:copper transport protein
MATVRLMRQAATGLFLCSILIMLAALRPVPAAAHSNLVQSDPPAQAVLAKVPARVQLSFSEAVEPRSIEVMVLDAQRRQVDRGDAGLLPGANDAIAISLNPDLPASVYTVQWKVTSAVDGHTTRGLVPFTVGDTGSLPAAGAVVSAQTSSSSGGLLGVVARWLTVLSAITLTGSFVFVPVLLAPGLRLLDGIAVPAGRRRGAEDDAVAPVTAVEQVGAAAIDRLLRIAGITLVAFVTATLLLLLVETQTENGGKLLDAIGRPMWDWLTGTRRGSLWLIRAALIAGMAVGLALVTGDVRTRGRAAVERRWSWCVLAALGSGTLLAQSLGSHSAALRSQETLATGIDWLHLLAVAVWVGGLVQFGLAVLPALAPLGGPPRTRLLAGLVPRFSFVAGTSVGVIVLSGIYQTVRLLGGWGQFIDGGWGRALLIKLALFVPLLALGAFNLLVVSPRLGRLTGKMDRAAREAAAGVRSRFRRVVLAEVGIAVAILLVVGALTGNSPGKATGFTPEGPFRPFILKSEAEGLTGRLVLSPGRIGLNRFDLTVTGAGEQPPPNGTQVVLRVSTLDQDTGTNEANMESLGGGRFTTAGTYLSTVGLWEVAALVRRPGVDEVRLPFQLSLTGLTGQAEVRENRPAAPIERGRELYTANCVSCHGAGARGDGPLAGALQPRPVDLTVHVPLHTDKELRDWISNGIPRTAMPAWGSQFSEEEIQAIINYLRQVAEQANQER